MEGGCFPPRSNLLVVNSGRVGGRATHSGGGKGWLVRNQPASEARWEEERLIVFRRKGVSTAPQQSRGTGRAVSWRREYVDMVTAMANGGDGDGSYGQLCADAANLVWPRGEGEEDLRIASELTSPIFKTLKILAPSVVPKNVGYTDGMEVSLAFRILSSARGMDLLNILKDSISRGSLTQVQFDLSRDILPFNIFDSSGSIIETGLAAGTDNTAIVVITRLEGPSFSQQSKIKSKRIVRATKLGHRQSFSLGFVVRSCSNRVSPHAREVGGRRCDIVVKKETNRTTFGIDLFHGSRLNVTCATLFALKAGAGLFIHAGGSKSFAMGIMSRCWMSGTEGIGQMYKAIELEAPDAIHLLQRYIVPFPIPKTPTAGQFIY
ncbi:hypothetical protein B0H13DRAFT_1887683 [Mycena leptocephala]|nr:hypothetical protein B0H13DRAFT_1887683 [Mycena leptocephala]